MAGARASRSQIGCLPCLQACWAWLTCCDFISGLRSYVSSSLFATSASSPNFNKTTRIFDDSPTASHSPNPTVWTSLYLRQPRRTTRSPPDVLRAKSTSVYTTACATLRHAYGAFVELWFFRRWLQGSLSFQPRGLCDPLFFIVIAPQ